MAVSVKLGYAKGNPETIPSNFTLLDGIVSIGDFDVRFNKSVDIIARANDNTIKEWQEVFKESEAGDGIWFEVSSSLLDEAAFFFAKTPLEFPTPKEGANSLKIMEIPLTVVKYAGLAERIEPQPAAMALL